MPQTRSILDDRVSWRRTSFAIYPDGECDGEVLDDVLRDGTDILWRACWKIIDGFSLAR